MKRNKIRYSDRLFDPINYKECCYYVAQEKMGYRTKEYIERMDFSDLLTWLGSNCGQYFIRDAEELIEEYPYKEEGSCAIVCGNIVNQDIVDGHKNWFEEKLKDV